MKIDLPNHKIFWFETSPVRRFGIYDRDEYTPRVNRFRFLSDEEMFDAPPPEPRQTLPQTQPLKVQYAHVERGTQLICRNGGGLHSLETVVAIKVDESGNLYYGLSDGRYYEREELLRRYLTVVDADEDDIEEAEQG